MKYFVVLVFCFSLCQIISAQSKDSMVIVRIVESFRKAIVDADKTQLDQLLSNQLSYGHSGGKIDTKQSLEEGLLSGASDFVTIDLTDQTVQIIGNTAIVRHKLFAKTNDGGKPGEVKLSVLLVWQKTKQHWQLIARQAIKIL
jgi:ketosteroid isomerase-like protein